MTTKTIFVTRQEIAETARRVAEETGGKVLPLRGLNSAGKVRGAAVLPPGVRGEQSALRLATHIVCEG